MSAINETRALRPYAKKLPAYAKQLRQMRLEGKMPSKRVIATFSWSVGKAYPRIVLADETPPEQLDFSYLCGLSVEIVYHRKDSHRVNPLVNAILNVNPSSLVAFGLDLIGTAEAVVVIKAPKRCQIAEAA
jgi:hypothetical protein